MIRPFDSYSGGHPQRNFHKGEFMNDKLIELMKSNLSLIESSIKLYSENQKLRMEMKELRTKYEQARLEKERVLKNLNQNLN